MKYVIEILIVVPVFLVWVTVVSGIARVFGIRIPLGPFGPERKSALQALTFSQHLTFQGVLGFGCGMLIATTLSNYLELKYWHGPSSFLAPPQLIESAFTWLFLAGVSFGLMTWGGKSSGAR